MVNNPVLVSRAWAAYDELARWHAEQQQQAARAQALQYDLQTGARVRFREPQVDHVNVIRSLAAQVIEQHQWHIQRNQEPAQHASAIAAWRQVLRTTAQAELERRLYIAIEATSVAVPRARRILHPEEYA